MRNDKTLKIWQLALVDKLLPSFSCSFAAQSLGFTMEMLSSAVLGDLASRFISFLVAKYRRQTAVQEKLQRLHLVLLRSGTIVEEAERRHIANRGMLRQLKILRDEMFRGYQVLDAFRYQAPPLERNRDEEVSRTFALSRFNPAKRARFASSNSETMVPGTVNLEELQRMISSLESIIAGMKEFVIFLMSYPHMHRQPFSSNLFLDKCMFGRHMERERVVDFLLQNEPPGARNLGVLPIVGPALIGKSTLVEHVCGDERVRNHFSLILFHSSNDLRDETTTTFRGNCAVKHQNSASDERLLIVIELLGDVDEGAWKRLYSSERGTAHGRKIIITSRSEKITSLGTTQAVRLKRLPTEAYWYFFKMLVFGSTDPEEHPKLASIAMELALQMRGSFMCAYIGAGLLRANLSTRYWCRFLTCYREYIQKNLFLLGEYPDDLRWNDHPRYIRRTAETTPDKFFLLLHESYQKGPAQDEVPRITMLDLLSGSASAQPRGKFEVLYWKSIIPPYYNYISVCEG